MRTLFPALLGEEWAGLPAPLRALHACRLAEGRVSVTRGKGLLARLAAGLAGLPPAGETALRLSIAGDEVWTRQFGGHRLTSRLSARQGLLAEAFGPVCLEMELRPAGGALHWLPRRFRLFGLRLPLALGPAVTAVECAEDGLYRFDVTLGHWLTGPVIRYRGWLIPASGDAHVPARPAAGCRPPGRS